LLDLERSVLAAFSPWHGLPAGSLNEYLDWLSPSAAGVLADECWYTGSSSLPVEAEAAACRHATDRLRLASEGAELTWGMVRSLVTCPRRFNDVIDRWGSKGEVLAESLTDLLRCNCNPDGDSEPVFFFVDKHGGRNTYAAMVQHALPDGLVIPHEEKMLSSRYSVSGLPREVRLTFQPRADTAHLCVALASMVSKYLREVLMREFNQFWQTHVPGLKATAGYPGDAARFFDAIRPVAQKMGIADAALWRRK
jgi:hypothetical protein